MSDLARMSPEEEFAELSAQMRMANTVRIKALLDSLEPYCDGSMGPVSPAHVSVYLKAVRELGQLWGSYTRPSARPEEVKGEEEQVVLSARQEAVLAELTKLREIAAKRRVS